MGFNAFLQSKFACGTCSFCVINYRLRYIKKLYCNLLTEFAVDSNVDKFAKTFVGYS
jgi:hypothetical protein